MKILHDPEVYLVGRQNIIWGEVERFLDEHDVYWNADAATSPELLCELAGRTSPMSFGKDQVTMGNKKYLGNVIQRGHGVVVEAAVWNFVIAGVSRSFAQELTRHRSGFSYVMRSQRYVSEEDCNFIEPNVIAEDPELHEIWLKAINYAQTAYIALSDELTRRLEEKLPNTDASTRRKMARGSARSILPNAAETIIFVSANARALRLFLELRASRSADIEIRKIANKIYAIMIEEAPNLFQDYSKVDLEDGTFELQTPHRKI